MTKDPRHARVLALTILSKSHAELAHNLEEEFGIEFPVQKLNDSVRNIDEHYNYVSNILVYLNHVLGPAEPTDGLLHLTEDQFIERYKPEQDAPNCYYRQRYWDGEKDWEAINRATEEGRIWTALEDDNSEWCICEGKHLVNRLYYVITEKPAESPEWTIFVQDPDESPHIVCDVDWDLSQDDGSTDVEAPPKQVVVRLYDVRPYMESIADAADAAEVVEHLSDTYGFCVNSFSHRPLKKDEQITEPAQT